MLVIWCEYGHFFQLHESIRNVVLWPVAGGRYRRLLCAAKLEFFDSICRLICIVSGVYGRSLLSRQNLFSMVHSIMTIHTTRFSSLSSYRQASLLQLSFNDFPPSDLLFFINGCIPAVKYLNVSYICQFGLF